LGNDKIMALHMHAVDDTKVQGEKVECAACRQRYGRMVHGYIRAGQRTRGHHVEID
jgi:hypothetical protein